MMSNAKPYTDEQIEGVRRIVGRDWRDCFDDEIDHQDLAQWLATYDDMKRQRDEAISDLRFVVDKLRLLFLDKDVDENEWFGYEGDFERWVAIEEANG